MQGEASWSFSEIELFIYFMSNFQDFSESSNLFLLRIIFACTLIYKESTGTSLMSVASLCLEFCMDL